MSEGVNRLQVEKWNNDWPWVLHGKTSLLSLLCNYPCCSALSLCLSFCLAIVLPELRLEVNFLLQHFSHHLQSGGKPMGANYGKASLSSARAKIRLCRGNSDYAELQTGKSLTCWGAHWQESWRLETERANVGSMILEMMWAEVKPATLSLLRMKHSLCRHKGRGRWRV